MFLSRFTALCKKKIDYGSSLGPKGNKHLPVHFVTSLITHKVMYLFLTVV